MKYKLLFILLILFVIFGCTKSQIKDSLKPYPSANQYSTVTIFPINLMDREFAECVQDKLKHDLLYVENSHSVKLNLQILFKTMIVVLTAQGQ